MILGFFLLIAATILVHLLLLPSNTSFTNFHSHFQPLPKNNKQWNPELQFSKKIRRQYTIESPIIVVGLPKAGTSTLFAYFHCLGFYSQHWYCCGPQHHAQQEDMTAYISDCMISNLQDQIPILEGCGNYDVYTELNGPRRKTSMDSNFVAVDGTIGYRPRIFLPQHYNLEELHQYAPNATWIFNVRPVEDWIHSVRQVPANMLAKQLWYEAQEQNPDRWSHSTSSNNDIWDRSPYRPNQVFLKEFWKEHLERVTSFVADHPSHTLVWVNITHPDAGMVLAHDLTLIGGISFPFHQRLLHAKNSSRSTEEALYSRARACWGAHNVKQYG